MTLKRQNGIKEEKINVKRIRLLLSTESSYDFESLFTPTRTAPQMQSKVKSIEDKKKDDLSASWMKYKANLDELHMLETQKTVLRYAPSNSANPLAQMNVKNKINNNRKASRIKRISHN